MPANFSIDVDAAQAVVRITLSGFFGAADVASFAESQAKAYTMLPRSGARHLTLCDIGACKIQLQEVVDAFRRLLDDPALMSRRIAFVTGNSPAKMQIRRLVNRDTARAFERVEDAERWLLACESRAAA
jgi:hypothetical protein